jgi:hypothetical protein
VNTVEWIRDLILHLARFNRHSVRVAFLLCFDFQCRLGHGNDLHRTLTARFLINREGAHGALHSNDSAGKLIATTTRIIILFDSVEALSLD